MVNFRGACSALAIKVFVRHPCLTSSLRGQSPVIVVAAAAALIVLGSTTVPETTTLASGASETSNELKLAGHWEGIIEQPLHDRLDINVPHGFQVDFSRNPSADGWVGTLYAPMWGERKWPLTDVQLERGRITFCLSGTYDYGGTFRGTFSEGKLSGTYSWRSTAYPFALAREQLPEASGPRHPQIPTGPSPYSQETISYMSRDVKLAGCLSLPKGVGTRPAVLLLSGSGPQQWDPEVPGRPGPDVTLWVLADQLCRSGLVVLRVDDRGVGGSGGIYNESTLENLAEDALAGIEYLRTRREVGQDRIGLLGISQGANVAALAASRGPPVAFVIMLAAAGVPGDELFLEQVKRKREALNIDPDDPFFPLEAYLALRKEQYELAKSTLSAGEVRTAVLKMEGRKLGRLSLRRNELDRTAAELTRSMFRSTLRYDPRPVLRKLSMPVLALAGDKDVFVPAGQNLSEIAKALRDSGNRDARVNLLPNIDHSFRSRRNAPRDATRAETEDIIDPAVLELTSKWIVRRFDTVAR